MPIFARGKICWYKFYFVGQFIWESSAEEEAQAACTTEDRQAASGSW